jgi:hypothetical protein
MNFKIGTKSSAILTSLVVAVTVSWSPATAFADPFGTGTSDTGYLADNNVHTYCQYMVSYIPAWFDPMQDAMNNLANQTDMSVTYISRCEAITDVLFSVTDSSVIGSNVRGATACLTFIPNTSICNTSRVWLNSDLLTTYSARRKTSCHEVGHSVGLSHAPTGDDCMISGSYTYSSYNSHHVGHINAAY